MKTVDRFLQRLRIDKALPYVDRHARVLDIGCADGALYDRAGHVAEYVGIDPEAPTEPRAFNARFIRSTFPAAGLQLQQGFDLITALAILEHIPSDEQAGFATACAAYLRPGGALVITVPAPLVDSILAVLKRLKIVDGMHEEQHYGYRPDQTSALFSAQGLNLERHDRFEFGLNHLFVFRRPAAAAGLRDRT